MRVEYDSYFNADDNPQEPRSSRRTIQMGNAVCPWWLAYTFDNPMRRFLHRPENILKPYVAEGMTVLDVGCGMGFFSIGLAKLVGNRGRVIAVDVQQKMLDTVKRRAETDGVSDRIRVHKCEPNKLGVESTVDFILAFWMVHETPDTNMFFQQIHSLLKPNAKFLIAEPRLHVSSKRFQEILSSAHESSLTLSETPCIRFSWSAVLIKDSL